MITPAHLPSGFGSEAGVGRQNGFLDDGVVVVLRPLAFVAQGSLHFREGSLGL